MNIIGVRRMLEISRTMKNLKCFMHISTAYAHTNRFIHTVLPFNLLRLHWAIVSFLLFFFSSFFKRHFMINPGDFLLKLFSLFIREFIEERVYPPSINPTTLIDLTAFVIIDVTFTLSLGCIDCDQVFDECIQVDSRVWLWQITWPLVTFASVVMWLTTLLTRWHPTCSANAPTRTRWPRVSQSSLSRPKVGDTNRI